MVGSTAAGTPAEAPLFSCPFSSIPSPARPSSHPQAPNPAPLPPLSRTHLQVVVYQLVAGVVVPPIVKVALHQRQLQPPRRQQHRGGPQLALRAVPHADLLDGIHQHGAARMHAEGGRGGRGVEGSTDQTCARHPPARRCTQEGAGACGGRGTKGSMSRAVCWECTARLAGTMCRRSSGAWWGGPPRNRLCSTSHTRPHAPIPRLGGQLWQALARQQVHGCAGADLHHGGGVDGAQNVVELVRLGLVQPATGLNSSQGQV